MRQSLNPVNNTLNNFIYVVSESVKDILRILKSNPDPFFTLGYSRYEKLNEKQLEKIGTELINNGILLEDIYSSIIERLQFMTENQYYNFVLSITE